MSAVARHPDLLTRAEAAALLDVSPDRLARGFGPPPLPGYKRPVRYSREQCEQWLAEQKERAWASTNARAPRSGGVASRSTGTKSEGQLARQIAARLRSKSADSEPTSKPRHLVAVPEDLPG